MSRPPFPPLVAAAQGFAVFPVHVPREDGTCSCGKKVERDGKPHKVGKHPASKNGVDDATTDEERILEMWRGRHWAGIGAATGARSKCWVLDLDAHCIPGRHDISGLDAYVLLREEHGPLETLSLTTGGGGLQFVFAWTGRAAEEEIRNRQALRLPDKRRCAIDVRGEGGYIILPPTLHPSGQQYRWNSGYTGIQEAPEWLVAWVLSRSEPERPTRPVAPAYEPRAGGDRYCQVALDKSCQEILQAASRGASRHQTLTRVAYTMGGLVATGRISQQEVVSSLSAAAQAAGKDAQEATRTAAQCVAAGMERPLEIPELQTRQREVPAPPADWVRYTTDDREVEIEEDPDGACEAPDEAYADADADNIGEMIWSDSEAGVLPPVVGMMVEGRSLEPLVDKTRCTDLGNARRLVDAFGSEVRYCPGYLGNEWLVWDGQRWTSDVTRQIERFAAKVPGIIEREAERLDLDADKLERENNPEKAGVLRGMALAFKKWSLKSESNGAQTSMVRRASADERIIVRAETLDSNGWLLNTPAGVYDLQTHTYRPHDRNDHITHMTAVSPRSEPVPLWQAFLTRFLPDPEVRHWVQKLLGYSLVGTTAEQIVAFFYGSGANGKSVLVDTVAQLLGDYAAVAAPKTFIEKQSDAISNDLAALAGVRLALCSETKKGERLDEGIIKMVSGGEKITARFLNKEFFSYKPKFLAIISTNHMPKIHGTDYGIRRRIRIVPFKETIRDEEKIPDYQDVLVHEEGPAILWWLIEGCRMWQREGLKCPPGIEAMNREFFLSMDVLQMFLNEYLDKDPCAFVENTRIYGAFSEYLKEQGEKPWSHRKFSIGMKDKDFEQHNSSGRYWQGLRFKE